MATKTADTKAENVKTEKSKAEKPTSDKPKPAAKKGDKGNYDKPDLREKIKEEIMAGDKGGKPGQWSARKAQLLTHEYEKAGGGYLSNERTESQQHLQEWTDQDWRTEDGSPADKGDKTARYLPAEAWEKLTPAERKATNAKKLKASAEGETRVANTKKAKEARKEASE